MQSQKTSTNVSFDIFKFEMAKFSVKNYSSDLKKKKKSMILFFFLFFIFAEKHSKFTE